MFVSKPAPPYRKLFVAFVTVACCFMMPEISAAPKEVVLDCAMRAPKQLRVGDAISITFELHNRSNRAVHVLMRNTPFEGFLGQYLTIEGPLGTLSYGGAMVKRGPPTADEYLRIGAHAKRRKTLNLAEVYTFNTPGVYRIKFTGGLHDVTLRKIPTVPDQTIPHALKCADIVVELVGK